MAIFRKTHCPGRAIRGLKKSTDGLFQAPPINFRRCLLAFLVVAVSCSLLGSSCKKKRDLNLLGEYSDMLCEAAGDFNKLIVWQNYMPASRLIIPSKRMDFLVDAEKYAGDLHIENFSIMMCQVELTPPVRDLDIPDTSLPPEEPEKDKEVVPATPLPEAAEKEAADADESQAVEDPKAKKTKKRKEAKIYYGTVLVRYMNRSILPSASVDTKTIKQYWINVDEVWYCDFEWKKMVER